MSKVTGMVVYEGPSAIDGAEIVVIVVGLAAPSTNTKTGAMLQSYILLRDMAPLEVMRKGLDGSICGDCTHRSIAAGGNGTCYVGVYHGPRGVWEAYQRGNYPRLSLYDAARVVACSGRPFRMGTYGDPGAVPDAGTFWGVLASGAPLRTAYTHRWRDTGVSLRGLAMASVDDRAEAEEAQGLGWATFRVAPVGESARLRGEAICPASAEAGKKVECASCPMACDGLARRANLGRLIQAHGSTKGRV